MQFLLFHLGQDRYGLSTRHLVRVLPLMDFKRLPHAPPCVAGLMNFHGTPVPVIDLGVLTRQVACPAQFDTRILLTEFSAGDGATHWLGLLVERVSHLSHLDPSAFSDSGVSNAGAPYLGQVVATDGALLQLVELDHLLPAGLQALLFQPQAQETVC